MAVCTTKAPGFSRCKGRKITGPFGGGNIAWESVLLWKQSDRKLRLIEPPIVGRFTTQTDLVSRF